jgi:hypothetical protein
MFKKSCPHCFKRIPFRKLYATKCPFCFKTIRQRSGEQDRTVVGLWLEDRGTTFWFFIMLLLHVTAAMFLQVMRKPSLLNFIDAHPVWFLISIFYVASFASIISRIYFPLMLGAPRILRRERQMIIQYKWLTAVGLLLGPVLSFSVVGTRNLFTMFPATVFIGLLPAAIMWAYLALALHEDDYEDERIWSYLAELGAAERLEHRHHGMMLLWTLPLAGVIFYFFVNNLWIAWSMRNSILVEMFKALWNAAKERGGHL